MVIDAVVNYDLEREEKRKVQLLVAVNDVSFAIDEVNPDGVV